MSRRWGFVSSKPQPRLTPKSAFLKKLERAQRPPKEETHWFQEKKTCVTTIRPRRVRS